MLKRMHSLKHVNALAADQSIEFASSGVTVIYGENAAGKSGYSRVLKRACHAREKKSDVLPNVFTSGAKRQSTCYSMKLEFCSTSGKPPATNA